VLFEGDGGLPFHIQELETLKRQGYRILICAMNDGGYGSEFHKLRADGLDDSLAVFGRPAFENIAKGFGLRGNEASQRCHPARGDGLPRGRTCRGGVEARLSADQRVDRNGGKLRR
jgi:thiamine pyrophosphate-dependent acetolactate synthase large subunit-like protein